MRRAYLLALHALLVLLVVRSDAFQAAGLRMGLLPDRETAPDLSLARQLDRAIPAGSFVIVGDSIARDAPFDCPNLGLGGIRSDQLPRFGSLDRASGVLLSIGTNDIRQWRAEGVAERVASIVRGIKAPVYLLDIPSRPMLKCEGNCRLIKAAALAPDGIHLSPEGYRQIRRQVPQLQGRCASSRQ